MKRLGGSQRIRSWHLRYPSVSLTLFLAAIPYPPRREHEVTTYTDRDYRAAGKYWRSVDPEHFARWSREEGTRSLLIAGRYFEAVEPDSFDVIVTEGTY